MPGIQTKGYQYVTLCKDKIGKNYLIHRLVATAFIGDIPEAMTIDHRNNNKFDNCVTNLQIMSRR